MIESVIEGDEGINRKNYKEETNFIFKGGEYTEIERYGEHTENSQKFKNKKMLNPIQLNLREKKGRFF